MNESQAGGSADLSLRIEETLQLMDRRGYGVPVDEFARLLYGGPVPPGEVRAALANAAGASLVNGLVVRSDRAPDVAKMLERQGKHRTHAPDAQAIAEDYAGNLVAACPLVRYVSLTGSTASGGFDPRDDIDLNMVVRDGAKYTVYVWSLASSVLTSLRHRGKPTDEMGALPFLPKVICVNVVWEERQVHPFVRRDKWLAYELLMHRPLLGSGYWERALASNPWLADHFPQMFEAGWAGKDSARALEIAQRRGVSYGFFSWLDRHPAALALVERASRALVIGLHKAVSLTRTRKPEAREREAFVNVVKQPYSVYDIPGRPHEVPVAALASR